MDELAVEVRPRHFNPGPRAVGQAPQGRRAGVLGERAGVVAGARAGLGDVGRSRIVEPVPGVHGLEVEVAPVLEGVQWQLVGGQAGGECRPRDAVGRRDRRSLRGRTRCAVGDVVIKEGVDFRLAGRQEDHHISPEGGTDGPLVRIGVGDFRDDAVGVERSHAEPAAIGVGRQVPGDVVPEHRRAAHLEHAEGFGARGRAVDVSGGRDGQFVHREIGPRGRARVGRGDAHVIDALGEGRRPVDGPDPGGGVVSGGVRRAVDRDIDAGDGIARAGVRRGGTLDARRGVRRDQRLKDLDAGTRPGRGAHGK